MASIEVMMDKEPTKIVTVGDKQVRVMDVNGKLKEAFKKPEMSALINISGTMRGSRSLVNKAVADFESMTTYEYRVELEDNKTRRAFEDELENPHEFLFARTKLHADNKLYKRYALVLWLVTGYSGYASIAGLNIKFTRVASNSGYRKTKVASTSIEVALNNEDLLLDAMEWWESVTRQKEVLSVLKLARAQIAKITYKRSPSKAIEPYIDWETAAGAVMGLRLASGESNKSAKKVQYNKHIRPDEKAQFIRDYIEAELRMQGVVDSQSVREMEGVCKRLEELMKKYDMFDVDKTRGVIASLRRSDFTRVTERQRAYLHGILQEAEDYERIKESRKVGEDLFDVEDFFDAITRGE